MGWRHKAHRHIQEQQHCVACIDVYDKPYLISRAWNVLLFIEAPTMLVMANLIERAVSFNSNVFQFDLVFDYKTTDS